jgi:hypothetical protein
MNFLSPSPGTLLTHVYDTRSVVLVLNRIPRRGRPRYKCLWLATGFIKEMDLIEGSWNVLSKLENGL